MKRGAIAAALAGCAILWSCPVEGAGFLERLGLRKPAATANLAQLPEEQIVTALKEALARGAQHAVTNLGRTDGFLKDARVTIPLPDTVKRFESGLRAVGQEKLMDDFVVAMNRAAERAVPEAGAVLADSIQQMSLADAWRILTSTNTAATDYFRRASETNLFARFLPIVKTATEQAGVTAAYKRVTDRMTGGNFGSLLGGFVNKETFDVDQYVTRKALDGLFLKIAEQEQLIRQNPAARTTELLQKVFGAVSGTNTR